MKPTQTNNAMSDTQYTPGPWYIPGQPWFDNNKSVVYSEADPNVGKPIHMNDHASFNPEQYDEGEIEANARLIAAAPELLEAAKKFFHEESGYANSARENILNALEDHDLSHNIVSQLFDELRDAVEKAEGPDTNDEPDLRK